MVSPASTTTSPPPSVTSPAVNPSSLSGGQSEIRVTATISDSTGVSRVYAYLQGMDQSTLFPLSRLDGTVQSGTWAGSYNVPNALNGVYTIGFNVFSNGGVATNGLGTTGSPPVAVTIQRTSGTTSNPSSSVASTASISSVDNQPPVISSPTISPSTLTSGQSQITVTTRVSDNVAVQRVTADISSATALGGALPGTDMTFSRMSGSVQNGLWMATYTFPTTTADGRYRVNIKAVDGALPFPNAILSTDTVAMLQRGSSSATAQTAGNMTLTPPNGYLWEYDCPDSREYDINSMIYFRKPSEILLIYGYVIIVI